MINRIPNRYLRGLAVWFALAAFVVLFPVIALSAGAWGAASALWDVRRIAWRQMTFRSVG